MHELHVGVQDMACDTFIKISQKCRKHFVVYQVGEVVPFIEEILTMMPSIIADLTPQQVPFFFSFFFLLCSFFLPALDQHLLRGCRLHAAGTERQGRAGKAHHQVYGAAQQRLGQDDPGCRSQHQRSPRHGSSQDHRQCDQDQHLRNE